MPREPVPEASDSPDAKLVGGAEIERRLSRGDWIRIALEDTPQGRRVRLGAGADPAPTAAINTAEAALISLWILRRVLDDPAGRRLVEDLRRHVESTTQSDLRYQFVSGGAHRWGATG